MAPTVIVGLGLSGLACALELTRRQVPFVAFEKDGRPGGLARSEVADGFRFDHGPHILLGASAEMETLLAALPGLDLMDCAGDSRIVLGADARRVMPAPFQQNLNWLSVLDRLRILRELTSGQSARAPQSYREHMIDLCGKRVFDLFLGGYESKRLCCDLGDIPHDWTKRVERPSLRSLVAPRRAGDLSGNARRESRFRYPRSGSIEALPRALAALLPPASLHCGNGAVEIDLKARRLVTTRGGDLAYDNLVISLPLPEMVGLIKDPSPVLTEAAANLIHTSVYVVCFGVEGPVPPWSFVRFPSPDLGFYRLSFPTTYAAGNAPVGASVVMAEMGHHPARHPVSPKQALEQCRDGLRRVGVIGRKQKILVEWIKDIRYGHVLYNRETARSVRFILDYLASHSVFACGKYGQWRDMLMTQSMQSGIDAARMIKAEGTKPSTMLVFGA